MLCFLFVNDISLAGWKIAETSKITSLEYYHTMFAGENRISQGA